MIVNLDPIEKIFDKVIVDLNITEHDVDPRAFTQWAMEAMEHIGGLNRVEALNQILSHGLSFAEKIVDHRIVFPHGILSIDEVRYYKDADAKRDDYEKALPSNGIDMDDSDTQVYFDRVYAVEGIKRTTLALVFNRRDGLVACTGCKLPVVYNELGNKVGLFVPALASYQEAIYWYITMKILWRDVFRGQNKGNQHQYAAGMWNNFKNYAYGDLMMPDKWELEDYADELSLGISYTGLTKRKVSFGRDNEIYYKYKTYWKTDKSKIHYYDLWNPAEPVPLPQDYPFNT